MTIVRWIDDADDVLLWMTAESPAGHFDSTMKLWKSCIEDLAAKGYVELKDGDHLTTTVTPAGEERAKKLRKAANG